MKKIILLLCLSLCTLNALAVSAQLTEVRMAKQASKSRLVFEFSRPLKKLAQHLESKQLLLLQFDNAQLATNALSLDLDAQVISALNSAQNNKNLQVRLQFSKPIQPHVFVLKATSTKPYRVVVDVTPALSPKAASPLVKKRTPAVKPKQFTVVIDAGHGGKDAGAVGAYRLQEKRVVLSIARRLQSLINKNPRMHAVMTRNGDYYVGLRQRLHKARAVDGDIFVAVHADAFKNPRSFGASVYALSRRGATSEAARWLAAKENYSELGDVQLDNKDAQLRSVLLDMSQTATIAASLTLGSKVLHALGQLSDLHHDTIERAPFVVLKSPDIPSILVETGFISNPNEARKLSQPSYQARLARAIAQGISQYFDLPSSQ